jgi:hypothetical protein
MQNALEMAGGSVGFTALFLAGIVALWYNKYSKKQENGYLFWYALATLVIIINPLYLGFIEKFVPELMKYHMLLWVLPVVPVILYVGVSAFGLVKNQKERALLWIGMMAVLLLAGASSYNGEPKNIVQENSYIPSAEYEILLYAESFIAETGQEEMMLWGAAEVMENARRMSGRINLLYGKDLWLGNFDSQMHQIYEEWHYIAYEQMQYAPFYLAEIEEIALERGCDIVVFAKDIFLQNGAELPAALGAGFERKAETESYVMYVRTIE